jgi:hypothetical protein
MLCIWDGANGSFQGFGNTSRTVSSQSRDAMARSRFSRRSRTGTAPVGALRRPYDVVCNIALAFPGVEASTSYGTPALKVKGRLMARLRTEAEGALALRCDFVDRSNLLQANPQAYFLTDHYVNYPMILVRLDKVRRAELVDLLDRAYRMVAPSKLTKTHDRGGGGSNVRSRG